MANEVQRVEFEKHKKDWDITTLKLVTQIQSLEKGQQQVPYLTQRLSVHKLK